MLTHIIFIHFTEPNITSFPKGPSQTHLEIKIYQLSGDPFAQSSWHIKLIIIVKIYKKSTNECKQTGVNKVTVLSTYCSHEICFLIQYLQQIYQVRDYTCSWVKNLKFTEAKFLAQVSCGSSIIIQVGVNSVPIQFLLGPTQKYEHVDKLVNI